MTDLNEFAKRRGEMPFLDHLEELRWRILWSLLAIVLTIDFRGDRPFGNTGDERVVVVQQACSSLCQLGSQLVRPRKVKQIFRQGKRIARGGYLAFFGTAGRRGRSCL